MGLKINAAKAMLIQSSGTSKVNLQVDGVGLEKVSSYVCLGRCVNTRHNLQRKIAYRRATGWQKFCSIVAVLKAPVRVTVPASSQYYFESSDIRMQIMVTDEDRMCWW